MSPTRGAATALASHPILISATEQWVDLRVCGKHIGFSYAVTRRMAENGQIPGTRFQNGRKAFWRFRLSAVDAALAQSARER